MGRSLRVHWDARANWTGAVAARSAGTVEISLVGDRGIDNSSGDLADARASGPEGAWETVVYSPYIAGLPESCGGCHVLGDTSGADAHMDICPEGLHMKYCLGKGTSAECVARVHYVL